MPSPERARPSGLSQLLTVTANCPRGAWPDALAARELGPGSALDCLQPSPARQKFVPHDPMPRARLPRRPFPRACHARATRRAHNGPFASPHRSRTRAHHNGGHDPAVHGPARPAVPRPDHGASLSGPRRRTRMASTPLGPTSRRGARLGPVSHVQTRRPCRRPPITAGYDYDMVFPVSAHSFPTSAVPSGARPGAEAISSPPP